VVLVCHHPAATFSAKPNRKPESLCRVPPQFLFSTAAKQGVRVRDVGAGGNVEGLELERCAAVLPAKEARPGIAVGIDSADPNVWWRYVEHHDVRSVVSKDDRHLPFVHGLCPSLDEAANLGLVVGHDVIFSPGEQLPTGARRELPVVRAVSCRRQPRATMCCSCPMDARSLSRRFDLGGAPRLSEEPVARGRQGEVWRLETADGSWAVKVLFHPCGEEEAQLAAGFQEAALAAGVPTPQVRRTPEGCVTAAFGGRQVRVYAWVDLRPSDLLLDPELVGATLAAIHQVPSAEGGRLDAWYCEPIGRERWDELVAGLHAAGAPFARRLADLRNELVALESWIEPTQRVQTCHRDLWADNVLPTADGGVCVIDWENSGPADPSQELACVLFEFARSDRGRARALNNAYREAGGPARVIRRGHFSMLIAQLGHITEIAATDWLNPNVRSPSRADSACWIAEVLDEPHTRRVLDDLLEAVHAD
jgi:aminoglycoside phosphotransferase (APT) family kinase protein